MRRVLVVSFIAAAVMLVPQAFAKGPVVICGVRECAPLGDEQSVQNWQLDPTSRVAPAAPSPYFVLRFADYGGTSAYWIPSAGVLRVGGLNGSSNNTAWVRPRPDDLTALQAATAGLEPYPAPRTASAAVDADPAKWIDMRTARGGTTYLLLYTLGKPVTSAPAVGAWLQIWVMGSPTPWTDGQNSLWISLRGALLRRDGTMARVPISIANKIRKRLALTG
jgi:hypothetical protein